MSADGHERQQDAAARVAVERQQDATAGAAVAWQRIATGLTAAGWSTRVVPVARLQEVGGRVTAAVAQGGFPAPVAEAAASWAVVELPDGPAPARSVLIGAKGRPLTQAVIRVGGREQLVQIPPHYAGYHTSPSELARAADAALRPFGYGAATFEPPLKTLATCSGLARYGRNNITYVEGLGSYHFLAACVSDAPPPEHHAWLPPQTLDRCDTCGACAKACPTGAIDGERFLLHTDRCLTYHNERLEAFPDWVDPGWHHAAVGCLRCQRACPANKAHGPQMAAPEVFTEQETALILAATPLADVADDTRAKMARCGLDYSPELIARNLRLLLDTDTP